MPKKGHNEEQIIAALKQYESGEKVPDICRKPGVNQGAFYTWKKQYVGMGVREMRQLREANGRLKRLVADLSLDRQRLQEIRLKKALKPPSDAGWRGGHRRHTRSESGGRRGSLKSGGAR